MRKLVAACSGDLAGLRDRALLLLGFAGALRRSELVGIDREHLRLTGEGLRLTLPSSKTDQEGKGTELGITRGMRAETCPVRTLEAWLAAAPTEVLAPAHTDWFCHYLRVNGDAAEVTA